LQISGTVILQTRSEVRAKTEDDGDIWMAAVLGCCLAAWLLLFFVAEWGNGLSGLLLRPVFGIKNFENARGESQSELRIITTYIPHVLINFHFVCIIVFPVKYDSCFSISYLYL
jgi:hypothetical protein